MYGILPPEARHRLRELLGSECQRVDLQIMTLAAELDSIIESADRANIDDEHDPEGATIAYERSLTTARLGSARRTRSELELAADRLDRGTFGQCQSCGKVISMERLLTLPTTATCIDCVDT